MYTVEFYETQDGDCQVLDFLEGLRIKAATNKGATFSSKMTSSFCFISFARNHRKLQNEKLKRLNESVMTICPEKRTVNYENLE